MSICAACNAEIYIECDAIEDALRELVELKRMKDAGNVTAEYERRKLIAWREAFRALGIPGDPKP